MSGADELRQLAKDYKNTKPMREVKPIIAKAALNIKDDLNNNLKASKWFKGAGSSVSYDWLTDTDNALEVEIGPEGGAGKPGAIANIAYFGASRGGGGTVEDPQVAADKEAREMNRYIGEAVIRMLSGGSR